MLNFLLFQKRPTPVQKGSFLGTLFLDAQKIAFYSFAQVLIYGHPFWSVYANIYVISH